MKKIVIFLLTFIFSLNVLSQPTIQWDKTIGGNSSEELGAIRQTPDGGYILGGWSDSNISGDKTENRVGYTDYWVVKLNSTGNIQWQNTVGGDSLDFFSSLDLTLDGGYILGGWSRSDISGDKTENCRGGYDYWVVKLTSSGAVQWDKTVGGNGDDKLFSVIQTTDGGYLLGGYSASDISGDKTENSKGNEDYWVVKLDASGNTQWQKTIGGNNADDLICLRQTTDRGYILCGESGSGISGDKTDTCRGGGDYWMVKIDSLGGIQWDKTIGGSNDDSPSSVQETNDMGYIIGGWSLSNMSGDKTENNCSVGQSDYWIVKIDSSGNIQWQNTIGSNSDEGAYAAMQLSNGEYIIAGYSDGGISCDKTQNSLGSTDDYWVLKLDTAGNVQWDKTIGGNDADFLFAAALTADGGCVLGGVSYSNISGDKTENSRGITDYWVVKLSPEVGIEEAREISMFSLYPNPVTNNLVIDISSFYTEKKYLSIYNVIGEEILKSEIINPKSEINISDLAKGIYIAEVSDGKNTLRKKFVKE